MEKNTLDNDLISLGKAFFEAISGEKPSLFNKDWWTGKILDWAMNNEHFKIQLFHFVDVLPTLNTDESLLRHIEEYFGGDDQDIPTVLKWGAKHAGIGGKFTAKLLAHSFRKNIETMARQFIIGQKLDEASKTLKNLRRQGFATTIDILGEASISEQEALACQKQYSDLLDRLATDAPSWKQISSESSAFDWQDSPRINISVKPTSLYSQAHPVDFQNSVNAICQRFLPLIEKAKKINAFIYIDMEQHLYKDITLAVYRQLRKTYSDYPYLGVVMQTYLRETEQDLKDMIRWAKDQTLPISIRLVKGAYWDYETIIARQQGLAVPVFQIKAESDAAFERCSKFILDNHDICHFACASHNIRSIAAVISSARQLAVPENRYEFQVLYGMAGPVRRALLTIAKRVRLYCPYGELLPGMGYLVRRLLENTANESFLRQSFVEERDINDLLVDPSLNLPRESFETDTQTTACTSPFHNEPFPDFTKAALRFRFQEAISSVRSQCGKTYPLLINGKKVVTADIDKSYNPAKPTETIGEICQSSVKDVDQSLVYAKDSSESWRNTPPEQRAGYLENAAQIMRTQHLELAALQVLEVGKQWEQAYMDVAEAIDFLLYYGQEIIRLNTDRHIINPLAEENSYSYRPKGVAAVIAPWNFPLAISCGMTAAALAAGNCVLYKPSGLAPVTGFKLAEILIEAGIPPGVFHFIPGRGSEIGDYLVEHKDVHIIAFTGSAEVGLRIVERSSHLNTSQYHVKKVIAEMGGKNAIIIDDDADLDQAVPQVLASAFSYQGQKCSACSRVIVVEAAYPKFIDRLVEAARSLTIGPAEDPAFFMGPVVDTAAQQKIMQYIELAQAEGTVLLCENVSTEGCYVPLTIVTDIAPTDRLANEEIFGPVLSVIKAKDFTEALSIANATPYALTGGVFSRSPGHLAQARRDFQVGNLYLNRGITGALVYRQPFGGFKLSGLGSKAGGPDYLLQFMDPVVVTENTMRRGFAKMD